MKKHEPFHAGEIEAQFRYNADWSEQKSHRLASIIRPGIDDELALFIEGLAFFFLATADKEGRCDCSFKGTEPGPDGLPAPAVLVSHPKELVFPDFSGNRMFNSLGNILTNPHVGLIFIDFASQARLRVNGSAAIADTDCVDDSIRCWPNAKRIIRVGVEQVYWNCNKRIPPDPSFRRK